MKAVVLAGGRGTRLAPYTTVLPKPLVPVGDKPILEIILRQLAHYGFSDVVLSLGHLGELIEAYVDRARWPGLRIAFVREQEPLGTAGPLGLVTGLAETCLVTSGDILTSLDYRRLVAHHRRQGAALTIGIHERRQRLDVGVIELDAEDAVRSYVEKPELRHLVSMGVYVCEPDVLSHIEPRTRLDMPELVARLLAAGRPVAGFRSDAHWLDVGMLPDHARASELFASHPALFLPDASR
jgi:NDP-mannose synthase